MVADDLRGCYPAESRVRRRDVVDSDDVAHLQLVIHTIQLEFDLFRAFSGAEPCGPTNLLVLEDAELCGARDLLFIFEA